jgi:RNA polymerase sigma-70 factor (ECF subfamily)
VLHDLFAVPFEVIAPLVGRTPAAARQLASRARRRVQGAGGHGSTPHGVAHAHAPPSSAAQAPDLSRRRHVVDAFLAASRSGDFAALLSLLDPDVVLRADAAAVASGAAPLVRGARAVAETFAGRARAARLALVDGLPGAAWAPGGVPRVVFRFSIVDDRVAAIELLADADLLAAITVAIEQE